MSDYIKSEFKHLMISATVIVVSLIIGVTIYNVNDRILMSKNIDSAIAKGMDPLGVRCSYVTNTDTICVAHAAAGGKK